MAAQRDQLIARMRREGFAHTCEAVAYTWFNRFAALPDILSHPPPRQNTAIKESINITASYT